MQNPRTKTICLDRCVIVSCIAGPACPKGQWIVAGIYYAMCKTPGNKVQAARGHCFGPGRAIFLHEYQKALALDRAVAFPTIASRMEMTLSHKVFIVHTPRLNDC